MKKPLIASLYIYIFLLSPYSTSQELDINLLENLTPAQIELARSEFEKSNTIAEVAPRPVSESTVKVEYIESIDIPNKKFGYDYFSSAPTSISALGDLPLPNDYKISLNDQFSIILSGSKKAIFNLNVNLDGTILFPELGSISVVGETFKQVKTKLKNIIEQSYIGVQVDISLKNLSAKKISIVGAVKTPGTYLVNPFTTISSSLNYSGGISEIGTLRNIVLKRSNGDIFKLDLYDLLINGSRKNDITIESGDVIIVGSANQFVQIKGEVKRPRIYEILETDRLEDIISYALGFTPKANTKDIKITKLDINTALEISSNAESLDKSLKDVLSVSVYPIITKEDSKITVFGAVKEPGLYSLNDNKTLEDLINNVDFIDTYPWLAVLEQYDEVGLVNTITLFNLEDPSTFQGINLLENSRLFFLNSKSQSINDCSFEIGIDSNQENLYECPNEKSIKLINDYSLNINHQSKNYLMPVIGKFKLNRFIDLLGLDMNNVDTLATYISPLDDFIVEQDYRLLEVQSNKFHTVNFRSRKNDLINVKISGAIDYPGTYTLKPGSSLKDLYKQTGSFKQQAFLDAIIFKRESVKLRQIEAIEKNRQIILSSINQMEDSTLEKIQFISTLEKEINEDNLGRIAGDFRPDSLSVQDMILVDNDEIVIPYKSFTVSVFGEVNNPVSFEYNPKITISSAIEGAGGTTQFGDKSRMYIIKANGLIKKPGRNIFTRNVKLSPGDALVIPRKLPQENEVLKALLPYTKVVSDLAFTAAALDNLSRN